LSVELSWLETARPAWIVAGMGRRQIAMGASLLPAFAGRERKQFPERA